MTVFVTGITGLLGANLTLLLLEKGYMVKGLVRDTRSFTLNAHPNLQLIQGNLEDDLTPHLDNVAAVMHIAAITGQHFAGYATYYQTNYMATTRLIDAAIRAGVPKFIYVSTANTIGYGIHPESAPENQPMRPPFTRSFYARSKALAEQYVLKQQHRITVHIINPTFMIGPYDSKPSSGKIILMGMNNRIIFYPPGGKNFVAVKDVALAIEKSIHTGKNGSRYLIAGVNMSYKDFFKRLGIYARKSQILLPLPRLVLRMAGVAGDILRYFNINTSMSSVNMEILSIKNYYLNTTSISELDIHYQPIEQAIAACVAYFKKHNLIKNR